MMNIISVIFLLTSDNKMYFPLAEPDDLKLCTHAGCSEESMTNCSHDHLMATFIYIVQRKTSTQIQYQNEKSPQFISIICGSTSIIQTDFVVFFFTQICWRWLHSGLFLNIQRTLSVSAARFLVLSAGLGDEESFEEEELQVPGGDDEEAEGHRPPGDVLRVGLQQEEVGALHHAVEGVVADRVENVELHLVSRILQHQNRHIQ